MSPHNELYKWQQTVERINPCSPQPAGLGATKRCARFLHISRGNCTLAAAIGGRLQILTRLSLIALMPSV